MIKKLLLLVALAVFAGNDLCWGQGLQQEENETIRFKDWEGMDWIDNDYVRELCSYIGACARGVEFNETLDTHRELLDSRFVVLNTRPIELGGLWIEFHFLKEYRKIFAGWVYGEIEEGKVVDYITFQVTLLGDYTEEWPVEKEEDIVKMIQEGENIIWDPRAGETVDLSSQEAVETPTADAEDRGAIIFFLAIATVGLFGLYLFVSLIRKK